MFFAIDLLCPQSGGRFSLAWVVATRGVSRAPKKEIRDCDVPNLCDELFKMVVSSSNRPRQRVSLALAARLINGLIKIHRCQVIMFHDDMVKVYMQISVPHVFKRPAAVRDLEGTPDSPLVVVKRRPRKAKVVVVSGEATASPAEVTTALAEPQVANPKATGLEIPGPNQANADLITLREEIGPVAWRHYNEMLLTNDFGDLGDGTVPDFLQPEAPILPIIQPVPSTPTKRKSQQDHPQVTPSKRKAVSKDVTVPALINIEAIHEEIVEPQAPPQQEAEVVAELAQGDNQEAAPQETPTAAMIAKKTNLKRQRRPFVSRNRTAENDLEFFKPPEYECELISIMPYVTENINLCKFWLRFMGADENPDDFQKRVNAARGSQPRTSSLKRSGQSQLQVPRLTAVGPDTPVPLEPHQMIVAADIHMPPSDEIADQFPMTSALEPMAQSTGISCNLVATPIPEPPVNVTRESRIPPAANRAEMPLGDNIVFEDTNKAERMLRRNRQKEIRDVVKDWNPELQGSITIEDVCSCPPRHTCEGIASTFYDLLCMQIMGYVKLRAKVEDPESIELGTIEKGARILNK